MERECPFCGHSAAAVYTQPSAGEGGVPRHRIACHQCGALSDFFDEYIHGRDAAHTLEKAWKAWNRRARVARSEDLVDLIGTFRSMLKDILAGTKAKTAPAKNAHACAKQLLEDIEKILPLAKRGGEVVEHDVNRQLR
jgi:hypothetical protein